MKHRRLRVLSTAFVSSLILLTLGLNPVSAASAAHVKPANTAEIEPNNTIATAQPIGVGVHVGIDAQISPTGDLDYFKLHGVAGNTYVAEVYNVASGLGDMSLYAYDLNGQPLNSTYHCNGSGNACDRVEFTASTSGDYFVRANAVSGTALGSYSIRVLPRFDQGLTHGKDGEPDDNLSLAEPIKVGTDGALVRSIYPRSGGYYTVAGDRDSYHFHGIAGDTYVAEVYNVASGLGDISLYAYDENGNGLGSTYHCDGSGNVCDSVQFTASDTGDYFLQTLGVSSTTSGSYSIRVLPRYDQGLIHGADGEPNDWLALAEPIKVGTDGALSRTIYPRGGGYYTVAGDQDSYHFHGIAGNTYVAEVYDVAGGLGDVSLYAYDANGNGLSSTYHCNGSGNVCDRVEFTASDTGDYLLKTLGVSSTTSGSYSIRVLPRYDQGLTHGADGEPNDWLALAEPINVGKAGALARAIYPRNGAYYTVAGDSDDYHFHAVKGKSYVAEVYNVASGLNDMSLYAYDSNGQTLNYTYHCNGSGNVCDSVQFSADSSGEYFLQTLAVSSTASGNYRIRVYQAG